MSPAKLVGNLINCLTKDEDKRQDLWVHYLSGNPPSSLASHLDKISNEFSSDSELQSALWSAFKEPPSDKFRQLLSNFSDVEQSIICLLALGLTASEVSGYKAISEIRIRQVISIVKENGCWEELYAEEKTNRE